MYSILILFLLLILLSFSNSPPSIGGAMSPGINDQMNANSMFINDTPRLGNPGGPFLGPIW